MRPLLVSLEKLIHSPTSIHHHSYIMELDMCLVNSLFNPAKQNTLVITTHTTKFWDVPHHLNAKLSHDRLGM